MGQDAALQVGIKFTFHIRWPARGIGVGVECGEKGLESALTCRHRQRDPEALQRPGGGGSGGALPETPEQKYRLFYLSDAQAMPTGARQSVSWPRCICHSHRGSPALRMK